MSPSPSSRRRRRPPPPPLPPPPPVAPPTGAGGASRAAAFPSASAALLQAGQLQLWAGIQLVFEPTSAGEDLMVPNLRASSFASEVDGWFAGDAAEASARAAAVRRGAAVLRDRSLGDTPLLAALFGRHRRRRRRLQGAATLRAVAEDGTRGAAAAEGKGRFTAHHPTPTSAGRPRHVAQDPHRGDAARRML